MQFLLLLCYTLAPDFLRNLLGTLRRESTSFIFYCLRLAIELQEASHPPPKYSSRLKRKTTDRFARPWVLHVLTLVSSPSQREQPLLGSAGSSIAISQPFNTTYCRDDKNRKKTLRNTQKLPRVSGCLHQRMLLKRYFREWWHINDRRDLWDLQVQPLYFTNEETENPRLERIYSKSCSWWMERKEVSKGEIRISLWLELPLFVGHIPLLLRIESEPSPSNMVAAHHTWLVRTWNVAGLNWGVLDFQGLVWKENVKYLKDNVFKILIRGQPRGRVVKFMRSASAAQGFASSDPGRGHGITHQAMLRRHPTCHH